MLYADFLFRMRRQDALCVAGWTSGDVDGATLTIGDISIPARHVLRHLRADLPAGATGFLIRFDLGGELIDLEAARLRLEGPARSCALPPASAQLEAMVKSATDEALIGLMLGMAEGILPVEDEATLTGLHRRAVSMAKSRHFAELPGAAVAQDHAAGFAAPERLLVTGWLGSEETAAGTICHGLVLDGTLPQRVEIHVDTVIRPDLAHARIRRLRVGATSGYVGTAQPARAFAPEAVVLIGMIHDGFTLGTFRPVQPSSQAELGHQFDATRRNLVAAEATDRVLGALLPCLPRSADLTSSARTEGHSGAAYVVEQDLDAWTVRDLIRMVRTEDAQARSLRLIAEGASEGLIRAAGADAVEACGTGPSVEITGRNLALAAWAPEAQHLVFASASTLFHAQPFADLAAARAECLPAWCLLLTDSIAPLRSIPTTEAAIEALIDGAPFVAQIDQGVVQPATGDRTLNLSPGGQMRWLLVALARLGLVTFAADSVLGFLPGRDILPAANRGIEQRAMRRALGVETEA